MAAILTAHSGGMQGRRASGCVRHPAGEEGACFIRAMGTPPHASAPAGDNPRRRPLEAAPPA